MVRAFIVTLSTVVVMAEYTQNDRIKDMQKLAEAMQNIQSGFFYNNIDIVKAGAEDLIETINKIEVTKEEKEQKDVYERWFNNAIKMTNRLKRDISSRAKVIIKRFESGDPTQALQEYSKISNQCMKCHIQVRKW